MRVSEKDKAVIYEWMCRYCKPSSNAKNKEVILKCLSGIIPNLTERYLRYCMGELKDENKIGSLSSIGYFVPGSETDPKECDMMLDSWKEMAGRAVNMIKRAHEYSKHWIRQKEVVVQGQGDMFVVKHDDEIGQMVDDLHKIGAM